MDINSFLVWLMGGGCIVAASFILERVPQYQKLTGKWKEIVFFLVATLFGFGAYLISVYVPTEIINAIAPYFGVIAAVFSYVFLGKAFHSLDKKKETGGEE